MASKQNRAIITVVGLDQVGIIAKVSQALASANANIVDISQTIMGDYFTMMMAVELDGLNVSIKELAATLDALGSGMGLSIRVQHEDIFNAMHRI